LTVYNLALYSLYFERYEEAKLYFFEMYSLIPDNLDVHFGISYSLERLGHLTCLQGYLTVRVG
jgi:hypothetical protein